MPLTLVTIAPSHYCEKARWALDRAGMRYEERRHIPLLHYVVTVPVARQRTVPILVTPHGSIKDSTEILEFVDRALDEPRRLFPHEPPLRREVVDLEGAFDRRLGPATRRFAYFYLTQDPDVFVKTVAAGMGPLPRGVAGALATPLIVAMRRGLKLTKEGAERSRARIHEAFEMVEARLADGRRYLTGERFTAADLTFAALGAPVVLPPEYGSWLPALGSLPAFADDLEAFRGRPAGQFILRLFREDRGRRSTKDAQQRSVNGLV